MRTIIYYSGEENKGNPEIVLEDKANVMFTYANVYFNKGRIPERYQRVLNKRTGPVFKPSEKDLKRFWRYVDKRGVSECWLWKGTTTGYGHGQFYFEGKLIYAHRFSVMIEIGRLLKNGECALHDCPDGDEPSCVNPNHLFIGTKKDNTEDMIRKGRCSEGEKHYKSLISDEKAEEIRKLYATGKYTQKELGVANNLPQPSISRIIGNKIYKKR